MNRRWLLLRYDVEAGDAKAMEGFLPAMAAFHRANDLPITLFCTGGALEARQEELRSFLEIAGEDPLFEIGDHSYSHVGVGYAEGRSVEALRADYERSFAVHERLVGKRPESISICGTGGVDGKRLAGFDVTTKARQELAMLADLGVRRINTFLTDTDESQEFTDYARLGYPEITGFPSGFSDTGWLWHADIKSDFLAPLRQEIDRRGEENLPMPVILHDWVAWKHAPDKALTHLFDLTNYARSRGFVPYTHRDAVSAWCETKES